MPPSIYAVPLRYHEQGLDDARFSPRSGIADAPAPDLARWDRSSKHRLAHPEGEVTIGVVGKYVGLRDAYKSLTEALVHGGIANRVKVNLRWVDAEAFARDDVAAELEPMHGILVPGGFGERGSEGKIAAVKLRARTAKCRSSACAWGCSSPRSKPRATSPTCRKARVQQRVRAPPTSRWLV